MATDGVKPQGSNGMCEIALKTQYKIHYARPEEHQLEAI